MSFLNNLSVTISDEGKFITKEPMQYADRNGEVHTVPEGFDTDFASIPRKYQVIFPPTGRYSKAAVLHDYLCESKIVNRKRADELFLEAMLSCGVPRWKASIFYYAVRAYAKLSGKDK